MNFNQVILKGVVSKLDKRPDEKGRAGCNHQYFTLEFDDTLCNNNIMICDWSYADIKDGDIVIVEGKLQSNQKNINDGYTDVKEWFIIVYGTNEGGAIIKVAE